MSRYRSRGSKGLSVSAGVLLSAAVITGGLWGLYQYQYGSTEEVEVGGGLPQAFVPVNPSVVIPENTNTPANSLGDLTPVQTVAVGSALNVSGGSVTGTPPVGGSPLSQLAIASIEDMPAPIVPSTASSTEGGAVATTSETLPAAASPTVVAAPSVVVPSGPSVNPALTTVGGGMPFVPPAFLASTTPLLQKGDLLGARSQANTALLSGTLSETDARQAREFIAALNGKLVFSSQRFNGDPLMTTHTVAAGQRLERIATQYDITWELLCRINGISDPRRVRAGQTLKVIRGPFHAVVRKSAYELDLYLGNLPGSGLTGGSAEATYVTTLKVGLGANDSTPTGLWRVEAGQKLKNPTYFSPRGEGVIAADDPKNPLGEFWIGLAGIDGQAVGKTSYGVHGTIEQDTIGKQASLGCIRLLHDDIELVFQTLVEGKSLVKVVE